MDPLWGFRFSGYGRFASSGVDLMSGVNYDAAMSGLSKYPRNSRKKLSNGYEYGIASYKDSKGDTFTFTINYLDDKSATAIIMRSPKTVMYEYDLDGAKRGTQIPYGMRERMSSDFESVSADYQEQQEDAPTPEEEWVALAEAEEITQEVVKSELIPDVGANETVKVEMTRTTTTNSVMTGGTVVTYQVSIYVDDVFRTNTGLMITQEQAEIDYQTQIDFFIAQKEANDLNAREPPRTSVIMYEGYEVIWNNYGEPNNQYQLYNDGELNGTYDVGDTLQGRDDSGEYPTNVTVTLPEWNWDVMERTDIIAAWEKILNMRVEGKYVRIEVYDVESVTWYQENIGARNNPFEYLDTAGELTKDGIGLDTAGELEMTQPNGQGVMLDDIDITNPFDPKYSGGLRLAVRNGFTVTLVLRTENFGYFVDNIEGLETTGLAYGGDFISPHPRIAGGSVNLFRDNGYGGFVLKDDEISIQLIGGDSFAVDIDGRYSAISDFSIIIDGKEYAKSGYKEVDDEFSVGIIGVSFNQNDAVPDFVSPPPEEVIEEDEEETEEKTPIDSKTIIIVVLGVIAVAVIWSMLPKMVGEE